RGRRVIPFEHFINNDLEYLRGGALSRTYTNSITKTKAADYGYIKWTEYLVPRTMWIEEPIGYDKHALWGSGIATSTWIGLRCEETSDEDLGLNVGGEEGHVEEEEEDELYRDVNINQGRGLQMTLEVEDSHVTLTPVNLDGMESIFETTSQMDVQTPTSVASLPITASTMTPSTIATITITSQAPILPTTRMNEEVKVVVQIQYDRLRDEARRENDEFLKTVDENMQKIIKEQVKEQVKVQVSKILSRIEQTMNEQLEAKVLTRSSHSSKTSYAVAADLSKIELKNILIKKIEGNKSIQRSDEQRNLYKALVKAYESDKIILDTYGETVTLKKRQDDDADKDEEPPARPDRELKRRRQRKKTELASAPTETATRSAGRSTQGSRS
nr:hypothetical protein [Tanacetum cinerariifolium]